MFWIKLAFVLLLLTLVVAYVGRWVLHQAKLYKFKKLLPYSEIEDEIDDMSKYFSRRRINDYIYEHFTSEDHYQQALRRKRESR